MRRLRGGYAVTLVNLACIAMAWPVSGKEPIQDTLDPAYVRSGATMSEGDCSTLPETVWVIVDGKGDCIRYYSSGLKKNDANSMVFLWFHGDRLTRRYAKGDFFKTTAQEVIGYHDNRPEVLRAAMARWSKEFGTPAIFIGRPGTYGSSGEHSQRRQPREIDLLNKAVDGLKAKHNIVSLVVGGQSGGGGVTAALLSRRRDITCAVMTSGALAVRARINLKGWPADATGATTFFDPIDHVDKITGPDGMRIFVVGDPRDKEVPFSSQQLYFEALKARGLDAYLLQARSSDNKLHHSLAALGMQIAGWCASGATHDEIAKRLAVGARG